MDIAFQEIAEHYHIHMGKRGRVLIDELVLAVLMLMTHWLENSAFHKVAANDSKK